MQNCGDAYTQNQTDFFKQPLTPIPSRPRVKSRMEEVETPSLSI